MLREACDYGDWGECEPFAGECGTGTRAKKTETLGCQPLITQICTIDCPEAAEQATPDQQPELTGGRTLPSSLPQFPL